MPKKGGTKQNNNICQVKGCKAWVVSVNMGYGHDRAAYPLKEVAYEGIVSANDYEGIPKEDKKIWAGSRKFYETFSRVKEVPTIGNELFHLLIDHWQEIDPYYPKRDLSKPSLQVKQYYRLFRKGFLKHLITEKLAAQDMPMVTSFFLPAIAADFYGYENDIYCICTDTDISRAWAPIHPKKTRIKYFAPSRRVQKRLELYGVPKENIFLTGFPMPMELIGDLKYKTLRKDIANRMPNLDPSGIYHKRFQGSVEELLGSKNIKKKSDHPLTITFAVGGAGAQRDMVTDILLSLKNKLRKNEINLILVAGARQDVHDYFVKEVDKIGMKKILGKSLRILFSADRPEYFSMFNEALHNTDILWTKPSELSFYAGLGLPIIMAEPIGSQEVFNFDWLRNVGAGIPQRDPRYVDEWLVDWLNSGWLARAAIQGFVGAPKRGAYRIEEIVSHRQRTLPEPIEPV